jgi:dTDP-4-amino-4,6-dideoxygalactose transaminase
VAGDFPVATAEYERVFSLPIWPGLTSADIDRVVGGVESALVAARR